MALRLYLSPTEQVGGYPGIPRQTQVFASTLGLPSNNGNYVDLGGIWGYFVMPGAGRTLPVFPFIETMPTGAATVVSINDPQVLNARPAGGTTYYILAAPLALGVMRITSALTVNPDDWIPAATGGGNGQWAMQYRDENWDNSVTYEAKLFSIPAMAYIWRPSTATMIGTLWDVFAQNVASANSCWGLGDANYYYTSADWSDRFIYTHARQDFERGATNAPVLSAFKASVAVEADDVMVVEFWQVSSRANTSYGSGQKGSMAIGGGTDVVLDATHVLATPDYEVSPTHNTFVDLPGLSAATFPTDIPLPAGGAVNLVTVTPMAGPNIRLGFDADVGITGPTIGAAAAGLGVLAATQVNATTIDLECAIRPEHPDGNASNATLLPPLGEADPLGPPVPTGIGATVI